MLFVLALGALTGGAAVVLLQQWATQAFVAPPAASPLRQTSRWRLDAAVRRAPGLGFAPQRRR